MGFTWARLRGRRRSWSRSRSGWRRGSVGGRRSVAAGRDAAGGECAAAYRAIDARLKAAEDQKAKWTKRLGPFAPIALFLLKIKSLLFLLFKLKFLLSLVAFFGIYWVLFGWKFAAGFLACLFIHEMGHYVACGGGG
jgi:hypothetical protein